MRYLSLDQALSIACAVAGCTPMQIVEPSWKGGTNRMPPVTSARAFFVWVARRYTVASYPTIWEHIHPGIGHSSALDAEKRCKPGGVFQVRNGVMRRQTWEECEAMLTKLADAQADRGEGQARLPTTLPPNPSRADLLLISAACILPPTAFNEMIQTKRKERDVRRQAGRLKAEERKKRDKIEAEAARYGRATA